MLPVTVVGNRNGKAVIHWPGLVVGMTVALIITVVVISLFNGIVGLINNQGWTQFGLRPFPFLSLIALLPLLIGARRSLKLPPESLPPLQ